MTLRQRLTFSLIAFCFFLIIGKLFYWQIVKADELSALGSTQYGTLIKLSSKRGEIKTSDNFPIATNKLSYLLFANPKEIKDSQKTAELLSPYLEMDTASISANLSLNKFWVPIKSKLNNETKDRIEKLNLPGVGFEEEWTRFYPEGSTAAHLIGFVGKNELGEDKGYFGLEGYYDRQLKGKTISAIEVHDALGRPILSKVSSDRKELDGRSLILSVDRSIQYLTEKKLREGIEKYGASGGMVGIIEPSTGSILAMAIYPSFEPMNYLKFDEQLYKNPFISNLFEPGSTFKSLVMVSGIDSGVVEADTKCPICSGPISIGGYEIRTWDNKYFDKINMIEVIQHSDNTGMVYVAKSLGLDRFLSYLGKFGMGELTNVDLQGEIYPSLRAKSKWYPIDLATAGFGQGISVTPIELLSAFSAIANNGMRMEPHVVSQIEINNTEKITIKPKTVEKPISSQAAKIMTEMLVNAVNKGEAKWTRIKGYRIAGKTGTAQIPIAGHYDPNKTIASFIGFAPADKPRFAMLVIVDRPTTSIYGSETAAPIFFNIAKDLLTYYNISPTE